MRIAPKAAPKAAPVNAPLAWTPFETPRANGPVSDVYASYRPQRVDIAGAAQHPTPLVESLAMASVAPPVSRSTPTVPARLVTGGALSGAQLETAIYATDAHGRFLLWATHPGAWRVLEDWMEVHAAQGGDGEAVPLRAGFFLGDGTGCGKAKSIGYAEFEDVTGLKLETSDGSIREDLPPMSRFLNRLLALRIDTQNAIMDELAGIIAERTAAAREAGTLDLGVETIQAETLAILDRRVIHTDPRTKAETELVTLERGDRVHKTSGYHAVNGAEKRIGLAVHEETGEPVIVRKARSEVNDDGTTTPRVKLVGPEKERYIPRDQYEAGQWADCDEAIFRRLWDEALAKLPDIAMTRMAIVTGLLLPIWKLLPDHDQRIHRAVTDDGQTVLGWALSEADAAQFEVSSIRPGRSMPRRS